ncbi:MAG: tRNA pseudouridine(38-40) synthase TruA [Casimicrobiaceae bacterium]
MKRIAIGIEYDGRPFCGWQSQASGCGIQDALQTAIGAIAGESVTVNAAGRTDQGVHATNQVGHFETASTRPLSAWVRGANAQLPDAIAIRWALEVPDEFHARFSARRRMYHYLLLNRFERPALLAGRVGWCHRPLDLDAMRRGAALLVGEHDFSSFRSAQCQAKSPVKGMDRVAIDADGAMFVFTFRANAFLHHMVRNIIGALVMVGGGSHEPEWIGELLALRNRAHAAPTFMPDGLYLSGIEYDPRFGLPTTEASHPWKS